MVRLNPGYLARPWRVSSMPGAETKTRSPFSTPREEPSNSRASLAAARWGCTGTRVTRPSSAAESLTATILPQRLGTTARPLIGYRVVAMLCAVDVVERSGGAPSASRRVGVTTAVLVGVLYRSWALLVVGQSLRGVPGPV